MTVGVSAPLKPNKKQAGLKERPASCAPGASETPVATHTWPGGEADQQNTPHLVMILVICTHQAKWGEQSVVQS